MATSGVEDEHPDALRRKRRPATTVAISVARSGARVTRTCSARERVRKARERAAQDHYTLANISERDLLDIGIPRAS